jgi:hypothetical protein
MNHNNSREREVLAAEYNIMLIMNLQEVRDKKFVGNRLLLTFEP